MGYIVKTPEPRHVVVHAMPADLKNTTGADEKARHAYRKALAEPKNTGRLLTEHEIDEVYSTLYTGSPWLAPLVDWLWKKHRATLRDPEQAFCLPPVLVIGTPGCGKTHLFMELMGALEMPSVRMDMSGTLEPWPISGGAWG
ncbi:ATP-binding protein [Sinirhodobacter populi]|uniref:ATP-binding protein n=1 Tax=Paenirhodobacter populi TaxID=2306993 RepID=A0A443K0Y3_9RHOB|nr:ATP-binding protein [Sinirhodobacter populi]RWR26361.1 ATP-binding protein [Sinirhodobacter populi]